MSHRRVYDSDPTLCDRVFDLLEVVFPGVPLATDRRNAERFGALWEAASIPFVREEAGRVVSHVGLLVIPLVVGGRVLVAGGVHGVATHPDHRRRGNYRAIMDELLPYADARYRTLVLTTLHPEYFESFGFRTVPEWVFQAEVDPPAGPPAVRSLDLAEPGDRALMHRLLEERSPVSIALGVGPEKVVWAFYQAGGPLRYSPELDLVIVGERADDRFRLYDLVGARIPPLEDVVRVLGEPVREVITFFNPDLLGSSFRPAPHDSHGGPTSLEPGEPNTVLMVRGPFEVEGELVMLPRPARC